MFFCSDHGGTHGCTEFDLQEKTENRAAKQRAEYAYNIAAAATWLAGTPRIDRVSMCTTDMVKCFPFHGHFNTFVLLSIVYARLFGILKHL